MTEITTKAIVHTFPNGERISTGHVRAGVTQQIARYYGAEADEAAQRMREHNPGHTFDVVDFPATVEHTSRSEAPLKRERRALIERGISVSLIGYDGSRDRYAFDEITR